MNKLQNTPFKLKNGKKFKNYIRIIFFS